MARADLLLSLVRAGVAGDRQRLQSTVEALAAEERAKSHHILADRLQRAFASSVSVASPNLAAARTSRDNGRDAILEITPRLTLDDLVLPLPVREQGRNLIEEHVRADLLRAHGMDGKRSGKTAAATGARKGNRAEAERSQVGTEIGRRAREAGREIGIMSL